jgi:hypothetical protein
VTDEPLAREDGKQQEQVDVAEQKQREPSALILWLLGELSGEVE